jgi:hypothetical protein
MKTDMTVLFELRIGSIYSKQLRHPMTNGRNEYYKMAAEKLQRV